MYNNDENGQLIFNIYGPHCEIFIMLYWGGGGGGFNINNGSILLLSNPLTNINLNEKYKSNLILSFPDKIHIMIILLFLGEFFICGPQCSKSTFLAGGGGGVWETFHDQNGPIVLLDCIL